MQADHLTEFLPKKDDGDDDCHRQGNEVANHRKNAANDLCIDRH